MPVSVIKGKVWKFGDNTSTDLIMPYFAQGKTQRELASYCMRAVRPEFAREVRQGDVIVGGKNFGCGSSRPAARYFIELGVGGVIAESFGRLFFRNSINLGFPLLYCRGVFEAFKEGETIEADFRTGEVKNLTSGAVLKGDTLPELALRILDAGGIVPLLREVYRK